MNDARARRAEQVNNAAKKYYANNKEKVKAKKQEKKMNTELAEINVTEYNKHLIKKYTIIKPLCLCGSLCHIANEIKFKAHSKLKKHQLFKSIIKLIHYNRRYKSIKPVVDKINYDYIDYKRVVREKM